MDEKVKIYLVSCSVLKKELEQLVKQGELDAELIFVDKYFHIDYKLLEDNLRQAIKDTLSRVNGKIILIYGDLCLGPNGEMKKLAEEYGMVKVDALNCTDCLLGGKGKINEIDPAHQLMILHPGMIEFFFDLKAKLKQENIDEDVFKSFFSQLKGIVLLDTLDQAQNDKIEIENLHMNLRIIETRKVGLAGLKKVILEAVQKSKTA